MTGFASSKMTDISSDSLLNVDRFSATSPRDWLPAPDCVAKDCALLLDGPDDAFARCFQQMGISPRALMTTPLTTRVGLMAAAQGQGFFHHELRGRLPVPEHLAPERQVWERGAVPVWEGGILVEPKYFSFFLDGQIAPYNPNYRRKWRAHELLHGVCGFFWHPMMTRFACYLGARLDELLPVVHWHYLDEVYRPRCHRHRGQNKMMLQSLCSDCEALEPGQGGYERQDDANAVQWIEGAWSHFGTEWQACWEECQRGKRVETPVLGLDASSDAMGYMWSHWQRLTAWSFGAWVEMFLVQGVDYHCTIPQYMSHIGTVMQTLVSGEIRAPLDACPQRRTRRALLDLAYRSLVALEWFEEGSRAAERAEDALMPLLERTADVAHELLKDEPDTSLVGHAAEVAQALIRTGVQVLSAQPTLPRALSEALPMHGYLWPGAEELFGGSREELMTTGLPLLQRGIGTAAQSSLNAAGIAADDPSLSSFVQSVAFVEARPLLQRLSTWATGAEDIPDTLRQWLSFEAWLQAAPTRDEAADEFGALPESNDEILGLVLEELGVLRCHVTLRLARWSAALVNEVLGEALVSEDAWLAAIHRNGEPRVILAEGELLSLLQACVLEGVPPVSAIGTTPSQGVLEAQDALLSHGFWVWLPAPKALAAVAFGRGMP